MTDFADVPEPVSPQDSTESTESTAGQPEPVFTVTFWGVRGNFPAPGAKTLRYGGNTACVEVQVGHQHLIFDGGTGLASLGHALTEQGEPLKSHLFFTHTHWDRIQGFPFFLPAFAPSTHLDIYGAAGLNGASIKQQLMNQMLRPHFFTPLQTMDGHMTFHDIQAGETIQLGDVVVETISLNPKTRALGFRVTWNYRTLVYATDTDPTQESGDPNLVFWADGADLLIFDGTYADTAYADPIAKHLIPFKQGVQVAQMARVKRMVLFHHDPLQSDEQLDDLEHEVQAHFPHTQIAYEGLTLHLL